MKLISTLVAYNAIGSSKHIQIPVFTIWSQFNAWL